jgi:hypothetical protein
MSFAITVRVRLFAFHSQISTAPTSTSTSPLCAFRASNQPVKEYIFDHLHLHSLVHHVAIRSFIHSCSGTAVITTLTDW